MAEIMLPIAVLFILFLGVNALLRTVRNWFLHRTIKRAIDKHPESLPPLIAKLDEPGSGNWTTDAVGWASLAVGIALACTSFLDRAQGWRSAVQLALIPLFFGAALLIYSHLKDRRRT